MEELESVERGETQRLMVLMPPGSAKSTYASVLFPPWFMGRNPEMGVLGVSNTTDLAERFSRRVRNIVALREFSNIFEGNGISPDSAAAGNWETLRGGEFFAAGMGSAIAGRRADLGLIDDPIKTRQEADSDRIRQTQWEWYVNDFLTRLKPGGRQILIQCMAGDTQVLMADGICKALRDIRSGDEVATYKDGKIAVSIVLNWANKGSDLVYEIRMTSGITVKANERHPFLVERDGGQEWTKVLELKPGDQLVSIGANGEAWCAPLMDVTSQQSARVTACPTIARQDGLLESDRLRTIQNHIDQLICDTDTVLMSRSTEDCLTGRMDFAPSVSNLRERMSERTGAESSVSITTTKQEKSEDCFVTTATSPSDMGKQNSSSCWPLTTYGITLDEISAITSCGREDVFDIQVAGTENFIANGLVSHNTRWHEDDLGGRILERESNKWRVVKLPMLAVAGDPLGRLQGERLWPEWFTQEMIDTAKLDTRAWNALYQQEPVPDEGSYFKKANFSEYDQIPSGMHVYGASDYAVTEGSGDFTEHGVFGLDSNGNPYVLDWWRGQTASDVWIEAQCDLIRQWRPLVWFGEAGPIRRAIEPFLNRRMTERNAFCRLEWLPSIHDKEIRARSIQALASVKTISLPKNSPWRPEVEKQLLQFPAGKYDDAVDVFSLIGRGLEFIAPVKRTQQPQKIDDTQMHWMG